MKAIAPVITAILGGLCSLAACSTEPQATEHYRLVAMDNSPTPAVISYPGTIHISVDSGSLDLSGYNDFRRTLLIRDFRMITSTDSVLSGADHDVYSGHYFPASESTLALRYDSVTVNGTRGYVFYPDTAILNGKDAISVILQPALDWPRHILRYRK